MKKKGILAAITIFVLLLSPLPVSAITWVVVPFEIFSDDGSKVFVFVPYHGEVARAAVYEIRPNERRLVYTVEDLSSFALESDFYFSADMMHFARRFRSPPQDAFEVFSYGIRTRVVVRSDFIEDYACIEGIVPPAPGMPPYRVVWGVVETQDTVITIRTVGGFSAVECLTQGFALKHHPNEYLLFDLATAKFHTEQQAAIPPMPHGSYIASEWAKYDIARAHSYGIIPVALFAFPTDYTLPASRAEFTALAVALYETVMDREITGRMEFNDTNDINVQKMGYLGVVSGVGNGYFNPYGAITREQAAVMLSRLMGLFGIGIREVVPPRFHDGPEISSWAILQVRQMQALGIMSGVGNNLFAPQQPYTREQSIITIMRVFDLLNNENGHTSR